MWIIADSAELKMAGRHHDIMKVKPGDDVNYPFKTTVVWR